MLPRSVGYRQQDLALFAVVCYLKKDNKQINVPFTKKSLLETNLYNMLQFKNKNIKDITDKVPTVPKGPLPNAPLPKRVLQPRGETFTGVSKKESKPSNSSVGGRYKSYTMKRKVSRKHKRQTHRRRDM
jgi:hypothetical protein